MSNGKTISKLKGFLMIHRRQKLLLKERKLSLSSLGAYHTLILCADWDKNHAAFACIPSDAELEKETKIDSTTWSRYRKKFLELGLLELRVDGLYRVRYFWKYLPEFATQLAKREFATLQEEDANLQESSAKVQEYIASLQLPEAQVIHNPSIENIDRSIKTTASVAILQSSNLPKETLNNSKETLNNYAATQQHSSALVPLTSKSENKAAVPPNANCSRCGKEVAEAVRKIILAKSGTVMCMRCWVDRRSQ